MTKLLALVDGYKTYICAGVLGLATGLHALGYLSQSQLETVTLFASSAGLAALRNAVTKVTP